MTRRKIKRPPSQKIEHPPVSHPSVTMDDDIGDFLLDRRVRRVSDRTIRWHRDALKKFRAYCADAGVNVTRDVDARLLRGYLLHLEEQGHNDGGVSNLFRSVRAFLRWCATEYDIDSLHSVLEKVHGPTPPTEPLDPIPLSDFKAMLAQCTPRTFTGERDRAILLVLLDTGIRHQELTDLLITDIGVGDGSIHIRKGKGGKSRMVFVGAKGQRALSSYLRWRQHPSSWSSSNQPHAPCNTDALWITDEGTPLTKSGIRQIIERRAKQAGVPVPGLHEFRRAFCVNSLRNGMDVISLQRLMGHSTLAIINRYLKLLSDDLKAAHAKHGVVDNL